MCFPYMTVYTTPPVITFKCKGELSWVCTLWTPGYTYFFAFFFRFLLLSSLFFPFLSFLFLFVVCFFFLIDLRLSCVCVVIDTTCNIYLVRGGLFWVASGIVGFSRRE